MVGVHLFWFAASAVCVGCIKTTSIDVRLDIATRNVKHTLHPWFLSLGMDSNLIRDRWETFDFSSVRLRTLAKALSPAYLRLMGTDGDRMTFQSHANPYSSSEDPSCSSYPFPATNFSMYPADWDSINKFAASVGWRLLFGFNSQLRDGSKWDTRNAHDILQYSIEKGYHPNMDFELGNEPDLFALNKGMSVISGKQFAEDYKTLRRMLDADFGPYYRSSVIAGPGLAFGISVRFLDEFLAALGPHTDTIYAVTWHHYYGGQEIHHVDNFTNPIILDQYRIPIEAVRTTVARSTSPNLTIWQGETSSTYAPPASDICETYVAGFMLLDKLGLSAQNGIDLVIRQTFYGFWFALVNQDLNPTPNYWTSLIYRTYVSSKVLGLQIMAPNVVRREVRAYAHCAHTEQTMFPVAPGSVIVYAMNLHHSHVNLRFTRDHHNSTTGALWELLLTPSTGLTSSTVVLNGEDVHMSRDDALPALLPRRVAGSSVLLPSLSYAFYILPDARADACM